MHLVAITELWNPKCIKQKTPDLVDETRSPKTKRYDHKDISTLIQIRQLQEFGLLVFLFVFFKCTGFTQIMCFIYKRFIYIWYHYFNFIKGTRYIPTPSSYVITNQSEQTEEPRNGQSQSSLRHRHWNSEKSISIKQIKWTLFFSLK